MHSFRDNQSEIIFGEKHSKLLYLLEEISSFFLKKGYDKTLIYHFLNVGCDPKMFDKFCPKKSI